MNTVKPSTEFKLLQALFGVYAVLIMSWIPRFPEVKANLGLSNGQFGTLISTGSFGAVASLFLTGHMVHKFGVKRVILTNIWIMGVAYFFIVRTESSGIFLICNVAIGWATSAYHISINAQSFNAMERVYGLTIARLHGMWALGTLTTAIISGLIVDHIPITWHVGGLAVVVTLSLTAMIIRLTPVLMKPNEDEEEHLPLRTLITSFRVDWLVSGGLLCAVFLEFATGDWSAIFAKERIGVSSGQAALPYVLFMTAMIIGRLNAGKIAKRFQIDQTIRLFALVGGGGFLTFLTITVQIPAEHKTLAFVTTCIAFTFAGMGSSLMAPSFYTAGNQRSPLPSAVVVGQMGVVNMIAVFILKAAIAWIAQFTGSLAIALTIPALMLISTAFFARAVKPV
ncbi:MAG: MFS transporter [Candidatus Planktophila sp.]|jgi:MFS family permease|nr:MFS transporter [Candidatus Planktophila sp.]